MSPQRSTEYYRGVADAMDAIRAYDFPSTERVDHLAEALAPEDVGPLGTLHQARVLLTEGLERLRKAEGMCNRDSSEQWMRREAAERDRDRYRQALEEIANWAGADAGATKCAEIASDALGGTTS